MPLRWDSYSDQPDIIRDKAYKRSIYRKGGWDFLRLLSTNLLVFPIALLYHYMTSVSRAYATPDVFFGLGINLDKKPLETRQLVEELGVQTLLVRIPLHDIESLESYACFIEQYKDKDIVVNILQDRHHVESPEQLRQALDTIFTRLISITQRFQIGNAINRKKWAIFSMEEYIRFYAIAYELKREKYPSLILLGSSVIDFEYYFTIRTLFNFSRIRYDQFSSLLYVDRRGAPENTQLGMSVINKTTLLQSIVRLSRKVSGGSHPKMIISEVNWPIKGTKPYAPTSETECVSLEDHANYLVRYYLLVFASGVMNSVYWHQLIAPGYGLVDHRNDKLVKYPAYYAFKTMISCLQGCEFINFKQTGQLYQVYFAKKDKQVEVAWSLQPVILNVDDRVVIFRDGSEHTDALNLREGIEVNESPIYLIRNF